MRKKKSNSNIAIVTIGAIMIQLGTCLVKLDSALAIDGYNIPLNTMVDVEASVTLTMNEESANEDASLNAGNDVDADEAGKIIRRTANIELGNTSGYTVSIQGDSNLVGKNTGNIIPSVTDATTLGQMKNNWGWAGSVGVNISDCNPATISFKGMDDKEQILGSGGAVKSGNRKVTMCFGARINGEQVADVYSNTVTLSVVAQPGQVAAFNGITQMQQMTADICRGAKINDTAQLTDVRDGKKYWVTKLLDNNCWMSQNLDLDLKTSGNVVTLNDENGDPTQTAEWGNSAYPPQATYDNSEGTLGLGSQDKNDTYSWDLGEYVMKVPTETSYPACDTAQGLSACSKYGFVNVGGWMASADPNFYRATSYTGTDKKADCEKAADTALNEDAVDVCKVYDAHYLAGNYYQWNAATAGTGSNVVGSGDATGSICPKNWELPSFSGGERNTISYMLSQYGVNRYVNVASGGAVSPMNGNSYDIALSPIFFVRVGEMRTRYTNDIFQGAGGNAYYLTKYTPGSDVVVATSVLFAQVSTAHAPRANGSSIRCMVFAN